MSALVGGSALAVVLQLGGDVLPFGLRAANAVAIWTAVSSFIALGMLLLFPDWTEAAVRTARVSTVISGAVGVAGLAGIVAITVLLAFVAGAIPFVGSIIAFVAMVPLLVFGIGSHAVSVVTFGAVISRVLGKDSVWLGVFVGALALTLLSFVPVLGAAVTLLVQVVGLGASLRITFGSGASDRSERSVPSAHDL